MFQWVLATIIGTIIAAESPLPTAENLQEFEQLAYRFEQICYDEDGYFLANGVYHLPGGDLSCQELQQVLAYHLKKFSDQLDLGTDCSQGGESTIPAISPQMDQLAQQMASVTPASSKQCLQDIACSAFASFFPIAGNITQLSGELVTAAAEKFYQKKNLNIAQSPWYQQLQQCTDPGTSCFANFLRGIYDAIFTTVEGVWALIKLTVSGIASGVQAGYDKAVTTVGSWFAPAEDATSDKMLVLAQSDDGALEKFLQDPLSMAKELATTLYNSMAIAVKEHYGCEQWSDLPYVSTCLRPMSNWETASCRQRMNAICGVGGFASGEIVTAFLTGGASSLAVNATKIAMKSSTEATSTMSNILAAFPQSVALGRSSIQLLQNSWGKIVASTPVQKIRQLGHSPIPQTALALTGETAKILATPLSTYLQWTEKAFVAGYRQTDELFTRANPAKTAGMTLAQQQAYLESLSDKIKALNGNKETFDLITTSDNLQFVERFVKGAGKQTAPAKFLTVENHILKQLNDAKNPFFAKTMIDQANDLYRRILLKNLQGDPQLAGQLLGKYFDFKGMRLAFDASVPTEKIQQLFVRSNLEFAQQMQGAGFAHALSLNPHGFAQRPEHWFAGGLGDSVDEAGLYARFARDNFSHDQLRLVSAEERLPHLPAGGIGAKVQQTLAQIQEQQALIIQFLSKAPRAIKKVELAPGTFTQLPSAEVFEILRKVKASNRQEYIGIVGEKFRQRFQLELSGEQVMLLRDYFANIDRFSPGVISVQRVVHNIDAAEMDLVSFDIAGLGAKNAVASATALERFRWQQLQTPGKQLGPAELLRVIRQEDDVVTAELAQIQDIIRTSISDAFGMELDLGVTGGKIMTFSGDDGIVKIPATLRERLIADEGLELGQKHYEQMYQGMLDQLRARLTKANLPGKTLRITRANRGAATTKEARKEHTLEHLVSVQEKLEQLVREGMIAKSGPEVSEKVMYLFEGRYQLTNANQNISTVFQVRVTGARPQDRTTIIQEIQAAAKKQNHNIAAEDIHFLE